MRCRFPRTLCLALLGSIAAGPGAGCSRQGPSSASEANPPPIVVPSSPTRTPPAPLGVGIPAAEGPEVAAFLKKKGWSPFRDFRIADGKPQVFLKVEHPDRPLQEIAITPDDYRMIARSRTVEVLDLRKVKNTDEGLKILAGIPQLTGIIIAGDDVTDAGVQELANCRSLDSVTLMTKKVTDAGIQALAALPKLRTLYLLGLTLDGSCFRAFAEPGTLRSLTLEYVQGFGDAGARHVAKLPNLDELKISTGFGEKKLTSAGIKAIVDARLPAKFDFDTRLIDDDLLASLLARGWLYGPTPPGSREPRPSGPEEVRYITLDDSKVTDRGLQLVLGCTNAAALHLRRTGVTDETLKKLSGFQHLNYLALEQTKVTAAGLAAIASLPIRHLGMEGCELTEESFKAFGKMTALEELWLSEAKMKAAWLAHLARLPKLRELNLRRADFDDDAVQHVLAMPALQDLTLNDTKLTDKGFQQLVALPRLTKLYVDGTGVSKEVYQKAKKERKDLRLYYFRYDR
jgi:hypothetical protein